MATFSPSQVQTLSFRLAEAQEKAELFRSLGYHASADVQMDRAYRLGTGLAYAIAERAKKGKVLVTPSKTSHLWDSGTSGAR